MFDLKVVQDSTLASGFQRTQIGWGHFGARGYSRPQEYFPPVKEEGEGKIGNVSIASASGALVGKIRTDVQKSIVQEINFTLDEKGCADFSIKLNKLPDFPILPFSIISIKIGETDFDWYRGVVAYPDDRGTERDYFEFRGYGLREYLSGLKADVDYVAGTDIGEIVADIAENYIQPYAPIRFNINKINTTTGVILANKIEFGNSFLNKVLDTLSQMASHIWGVDGNGEFYFEKPNQSDIEQTYFIGYDLQEFKPKVNLQEVKNTIIVQRQQGRGSGGAGWSVAGIFNNLSSIKKYGKRELNFQIPGFFEDDDADIVGSALLDEKSEPKESATASGFVIQSILDYQNRGTYRFVLPFKDYTVLYSDVDDETQWQKQGTGDLTISKENDLLVHGDGCVRLDFANALSDSVLFERELIGNIQTIRFYIRSNRQGSFASVGVGLTNFDENITKIDFPVADIFYNFEWDVSQLDLKKISKFGIRIDENLPTTTIYIDKIEFLLKGHKYYKLRLKQSKYRFSPNNQTVSSEFGILPPKMENYLAGLFSTAEELRFTGEVR